MIKLYIMRHAESEANSSRIMASRMPYPLTEAGRIDSELIALELKELVSLDKIISSPLIRAKQTADAFCSIFNLEVDIDDRILEQDLGKYSGMDYDEVKTYPEYETNSLKRWNWKPEGGGESYSDIAERITSFFNDFDINDNSSILIITHAVAFRLIRAVLENTLPIYPEDFPNNGEIWKINFKGLGEVHTIKSIYLGNSKKFIHNP